jgi:hypothetical protein
LLARTDERQVDVLPQEVVGHRIVPSLAHERDAAQLVRSQAAQDEIQHFRRYSLEARAGSSLVVVALDYFSLFLFLVADVLHMS